MKKEKPLNFKKIIPEGAIIGDNYDFLPHVYHYGEGVYFLKSACCGIYHGYTLQGVLDELFFRGFLKDPVELQKNRIKP